MKNYWIIGILCCCFYTVCGQNVESINIKEEVFINRDSLIDTTIIILKSQWERKLEKLRSLGRRPRIGLVLSGGGAKGFAHIAVLKAFEKYHLQLDYIGGTSIGGLVGGLYAIGYTSGQLDSIFNTIDFNNLFKDEYSRIEKPFIDRVSNNDKYLLSLPFDRKNVYFPLSYSKGQKLADIVTELTNYRTVGIHDFSKFQIPFFCVAANLTTGKEKVFDSGYLCEAIMASMALPSLFSPVRIEDTLYVDGGIVDNMPVEVMKNKGVDIVIAVDISDHLDKPTLNSIISYIDYLFTLVIQKNVDIQSKYTDILVRPDISLFSAMSFKQKDSIYQKGVEAINLYEKQLQNIVALCKEYPRTIDTVQSKLNLSSPNSIPISKLAIQNSPDSIIKKPKKQKRTLRTIKQLVNTILVDTAESKSNITPPNSIVVSNVSIQGSSDSIKIKRNEKIKFNTIQQIIKRLYSTGFFNKIYYTLDTAKNNTYKLTFHNQESPYNNFLKVGIHYDMTYSFGLLLNYTARKKFPIGSFVRRIDFATDLIASNLYRGEIRYFQYNTYFPNFGITANYAFITPSIYSSLDQNDITTAAFRTINMQQFNAQFYFNYILQFVGISPGVRELIGLNAGIQAQYTNFKISQNPRVFFAKGWNYNFFASSMSDKRNHNTFPSAGFMYDVSYKLIPISLLSDVKNISIIHDLKASVEGYIPMGKIVSAGLGASAFYLSGNVPSYMYNIGGTNTQPYFYNEQFYGYNYGSFFTTFYMKGLVSFQVQFYRRHYIQAIGNVMTTLRQDVLRGFPKNFEAFDLHYGFGLSYGWDSPIGPVKVTYSYAPSAKNFAYEQNALKGVFFISIGHVF